MKIIHLILGKANPDRMNGVNKLVYEMVSTQHRLGFDVRLWGITQNPVHDYPERHFKTELFQMMKNKLSLHQSIKKAIAQLPQDTVVHLHGSFIPEFYHFTKLLRSRKIAYVYTPHGALAPAAMKRRGWKKKIYLKLFEEHLIKNAACIVATGQSVYDNVSRLVPIKNKVLIPNGQPIIPRAEIEERTEMIFGFCGRIALEHKGLDLLLEGFKIFKDKGGEAKLHLIGDGAEMSDFKNIARRLEILDELTLYGARFGHEKIEILSGFDVFVHSSRMEGFPAAVLEACAMGLPVLISRHTNVWDYIEEYDCGILIEPNVPEVIAERMLEYEKLYREKRIGEMGQRARQMIAEQFDWEVICRKLYAAYGKAVKNTYTTTI